MANSSYLDDNDRKLILDTRKKLDKVTKLMEELLETVEILNDQEMMKNIKNGQEDIKAGKIKDFDILLN